MPNVACTNASCTEYGISKGNYLNTPAPPVEEIICGKCGGPVEETSEPAVESTATETAEPITETPN